MLFARQMCYRRSYVLLPKELFTKYKLAVLHPTSKNMKYAPWCGQAFVLPRPSHLEALRGTSQYSQSLTEMR